MTRVRIAVLASGGGSNLQAILDHLDRRGDARPADVVLVASDRAASGALQRAHTRDIPTALVPTLAHPDALPLEELLAAHGIDLVVLAGFLRLVPPEVVRRYQGRMLNVHPALLPAFGGPGMYGLRVHEAVLASGACVSGVTVHLVNDEFDRGTILVQWPVPVRAGDDARALAARVLRVEHLLYPRVVEAVASGALRVDARDAATHRGLRFPAEAGARTVSFSLHTLEDVCLANEIDRALGR